MRHSLEDRVFGTDNRTSANFMEQVINHLNNVTVYQLNLIIRHLEIDTLHEIQNILNGIDWDQPA